MGKIEYKSELINYELDSIDELYFLYWLEELNDKQLITKIEHNNHEFKLNDSVDIKMKVDETSEYVIKNIIKDKSYTPDFIFELDSKLFQIIVGYDDKVLSKDKKKRKVEFDNIIFYFNNTITAYKNKHNEFISHIFVDVKGAYTKQFNSSITFPDRQAMLYNYLGIYVNKVIVFDNKVKSKCLFAKTFTPKKVIDEMIYKRDTGNNKIGDTKIKYKIVTIDEYLTRIGI